LVNKNNIKAMWNMVAKMNNKSRSLRFLRIIYFPIVIWGCLNIVALPCVQTQIKAGTIEETTTLSPASDFLANQFIQPIDVTVNGASNVSKDNEFKWSSAIIQKFLLKQTFTNFNATFVTQDDNRCQAVAFVLFPFHEFW